MAGVNDCIAHCNSAVRSVFYLLMNVIMNTIKTAFKNNAIQYRGIQKRTSFKYFLPKIIKLC